MYQNDGQTDKMVSQQVSFMCSSRTLLILRLDVEQLGVVKCDITNVPEGSLQLRSNYETGERYTRAFLICRIRAALSNLEVEVLVTDGIKQLPGDAVKETKIGSTTIQLIEGASGRRNSFDSGVSDP